MKRNLTALALIGIIMATALFWQRQQAEADPLMALLAFGQAPPSYRPPRGGIPAVVEELRILFWRPRDSNGRRLSPLSTQRPSTLQLTLVQRAALFQRRIG